MLMNYSAIKCMVERLKECKQRTGDAELPVKINDDLDFMKMLGFFNFNNQKYLSDKEVYLNEMTIPILRRLQGIYNITFHLSPEKENYIKIESMLSESENVIQVEILYETENKSEDANKIEIDDLFKWSESFYKVVLGFYGHLAINKLGPLTGAKDISIRASDGVAIERFKGSFIDHFKIEKAEIGNMKLNNAVVEVSGSINNLEGERIAVIADRIGEVYGENGIVIANEIGKINGKLKVLTIDGPTSISLRLEHTPDISKEILEKMKKYVLDKKFKKLVDEWNHETMANRVGGFVVYEHNKNEVYDWLKKWFG